VRLPRVKRWSERHGTQAQVEDGMAGGAWRAHHVEWLSGEVPVWGMSWPGQGVVGFPFVPVGWWGCRGAMRQRAGSGWAGTHERPTGTKSCTGTGDQGEGQPQHGWVVCSDCWRGNLADAANDGHVHGGLGEERGRPLAHWPARVSLVQIRFLLSVENQFTVSAIESDTI
jgi:hypothetical protein